jgi:hypothetical protein
MSHIDILVYTSWEEKLNEWNVSEDDLSIKRSSSPSSILFLRTHTKPSPNGWKMFARHLCLKGLGSWCSLAERPEWVGDREVWHKWRSWGRSVQLGEKSTKNNHLMYTIFQHSQHSSCFPTKHFYNRTELAKNEPIITKYKQTVANYHKFIHE